MKRLLILSFIFAFLISCVPGGGVITDVSDGMKKTGPKVLSWRVEENKVFTIWFSETLELKEALVGGKTLLREKLGSKFSLTLPYTLSPGEKINLLMTVEDSNGNKTRFSFLLRGKNYYTPSLLINEVSVKGTQSNPDRIELYVLSSGNTAGVEVSDEKYSFFLPSIDVKEGDILLIYWDKKTTKKNWERERGTMTYVLSASSPSTLSGPEGMVIVRKEENGEMMDALFYSEKGEDAFKDEGRKKVLEEAKEKGMWDGEVFDSSLSTSSRVISRLPGAVDSDSSDDFFITAPRRSTFGETNDYAPYQGI